MELTLGRFGDLRLEKGGPFSQGGCSNVAGAGCVSGVLGATEPGRCGSRAFCATDR